MLQLIQIHKAFDNSKTAVISNFSHDFKQGSTWQIDGASGRGKTTLLRILLGLETADSGQYHKPPHYRFSAMLQEDRLLPWCNAVENVRFVCPPDVSDAQIVHTLTQVLDRADLDKPASTLSGGMKRRVALVRALLAPSDCIVLDEPFTGLDAENVQRALQLIQRLQGARTLLIVCHEMQLSDAKVLQL